MNHKESFITYLKLIFPKIVPEYKFHPERKWRFDFALVKEKIAFEYDGGVFIRGRHSRGAGMIKDNEKCNSAQILGWKVFKFCTGSKFTNMLDNIKHWVKDKQNDQSALVERTM